MEIKINSLPYEKRKVKHVHENELGFGKVFTDHMFFAEWKEDRGWFNAEVKPYAPLILDPSSLIFHYGQEIFEGLKAYRWQDGTISLFRPELNARRFQLSADRLCMPIVPEEFFVEAIEKLIAVDKDWVPSLEGTSLYIRPTMIGVDPVLGLRSASHYYFFIILTPVSHYYASGISPIKLLVEDLHVRATKGGTGEAKTSGNYAAGLKASQLAKKRGYDQVLWLDSQEREYIEEAGAMNIFFAHSDKIVTPPLEGSILHGVTRDSILKLARHMGLKTEERKISINEVIQGIESGKIEEAFCSGTAAVVTPIGELYYKNSSCVINGNKIGQKTQRIYDTLTEIQYGKYEDPFNWIRKIS